MSNIYLASRDGANQFLTKAQADQLYATSGAVNGKLDLTGGTIRPTTNSTSTFRVSTQSGLARLSVDTSGNNGGVQTLGGYTSLDTFQTSIRPGGGQFFVTNSAGTTQVLTVDSTLGATTFQTSADSTNAFRVNTRQGNALFQIDNTVGNANISLVSTNLSLNGSFTSVRPSASGSFRVRDQSDTSTWMTVSGADGATTFQNSTNSANAFRIQNLAGNNILRVDTSLGTTIIRNANDANPSLQLQNAAGNVTVNMNNNFRMFQVPRIQCGTIGATPGIATGNGAGSAPTAVSITGYDMAGRVSLTTGGTAPTSFSIIATITFADAGLATPSSVVITPNSSGPNQNLCYAVAVSNSNWQIWSGSTALSNGVTYSWYYTVIF